MTGKSPILPSLFGRAYTIQSRPNFDHVPRLRGRNAGTKSFFGASDYRYPALSLQIHEIPESNTWIEDLVNYLLITRLLRGWGDAKRPEKTRRSKRGHLENIGKALQGMTLRCFSARVSLTNDSLHFRFCFRRSRGLCLWERAGTRGK